MAYKNMEDRCWDDREFKGFIHILIMIWIKLWMLQFLGGWIIFASSHLFYWITKPGFSLLNLLFTSFFNVNVDLKSRNLLNKLTKQNTVFLSCISSKTSFFSPGHICSRKQHPRLLLRHECKKFTFFFLAFSYSLLPVNHLTPTAGNNSSETRRLRASSLR